MVEGRVIAVEYMDGAKQGKKPGLFGKMFK